MGVGNLSCINSYRDDKKWLIKRKKARRNTASKQRGNTMRKKILEHLKNKKAWAVVAIAVICYWLWTTYNTVAAV